MNGKWEEEKQEKYEGEQNSNCSDQKNCRKKYERSVMCMLGKYPAPPKFCTPPMPPMYSTCPACPIRFGDKIYLKYTINKNVLYIGLCGMIKVSPLIMASAIIPSDLINKHGGGEFTIRDPSNTSSTAVVKGSDDVLLEYMEEMYLGLDVDVVFTCNNKDKEQVIFSKSAKNASTWKLGQSDDPIYYNSNILLYNSNFGEYINICPSKLECNIFPSLYIDDTKQYSFTIEKELKN